MPRTLSRASSPPTMWPRGHVSWYSTRARDRPVDAGTTTHGPGTGTHTCSPSHSFAAPAGSSSRERGRHDATSPDDAQTRHQTPF